MSYKIIKYDEGQPMLRVIIDDHEVFGMTMNPVAATHHQWLAEHLDSAFRRAIDDAVRRARQKDQAEFRKLLGIGDSR